MGVNRFECRACPYEYVVGKEYYERTEVKQKEVEDVFGGKEEFANADSVASEWSCLARWIYFHTVAAVTGPRLTIFLRSTMSRRELQWRTGVLLPAADSQRRRADDYVFEGRLLTWYREVRF